MRIAIIIVLVIIIIAYIAFGINGAVIAIALSACAMINDDVKTGGAGKRKPGDTLHFDDFPDFKPNLTPAEIFEMGSFGGTYWRPIHSSVTGKDYDDKQYLKHKYLRKIPKDKMTKDFADYDVNVNKYGVRVGQTLEEWEKKGWITKYDPYGWVQWYCNFYDGRRTPDDERQVKRWVSLAGEKGRFRGWLLSDIKKKYPNNPKKGRDDYSISPAKRQTLQHWAYMLV